MTKLEPETLELNIEAPSTEAFIPKQPPPRFEVMELESADGSSEENSGVEKDRPKWDRSLEYMMSLISLSVGLGNLWRFPATCFENGGAAFLIPYIIILFLVGKPFYFLEMVIGQFTSRGSMKAMEILPIMKGIGWGQQIASSLIATYYTSIIGLTLTYFVRSFAENLPWASCLTSTSSNFENCYDSSSIVKLHSSALENATAKSNKMGSSQVYFDEKVLEKKLDISDGLGGLVWPLVASLFVSWLCIYISIVKGIKTSGKCAYVFAILPYVILISLLSYACTLDGAFDGIKYLFEPDFSKIWTAKIWFDACSQCFYSLTVGMGCIIMFSSYNKFNHNIYRDATIISLMDTFTSVLGASAIFAILGNLSHNQGVTLNQLKETASFETFGLVFTTYPDAIAKMMSALPNPWYIPQIMAIIFFFMLFVLGVGSSVGLMNNLATNLKDYFPKVKYWQFAGVSCLIGFFIGLLYVTRGGLHVIGIVDFFGGQFLIFALATGELISIVWIYGLQNICWDVEFMLKIKLSAIWRICWGVIMPIFMLTLCTLKMIELKNPEELPTFAIVCGWVIFIFGFSQLFICSGFLYFTRSNNYGGSFVKYLFSPNTEWGPEKFSTRSHWRTFKDGKRKIMDFEIAQNNHSFLYQKVNVLLGWY